MVTLLSLLHRYSSALRYRRRYGFALLRVGALLFTLNLLFGVYFLRQAEGKAREVLLRAGEPFLALAGSQAQSPQVLELNGARFRAQSLRVPRPWREVMDAVAARCSESSGLSVDEAWLSKLAHGGATKRLKQLAQGVLRLEGEGEGLVVCFEQQGPVGLTEQLARLEALSTSGDLASFGRPRYFRVKATLPEASFVLSVWADGAVNLNRMFPKSGDAEGRDPELIPRPKESRRLLACASHAAGPWVNTYLSQQPPSSVSAFYRDELTKKGWSLEQPSPGVLRAYRELHHVELALQEISEGTLVTLSSP